MVASFEVKAPLFPSTCANVKPLPTGQLRLGGVFIANAHRCLKVGGECKKDTDCTSTKQECEKAFPKKPHMFTPPGPAKCVQGICRSQEGDAGYECDCFSGCKEKLFSEEALTCTDGTCKQKPCGDCGEVPKSGGCCGRGIVVDGKCWCGTGVGEGCAVKGVCPGKTHECCGKGTKQEGKCCRSSSCNSKFCDTGGAD